MGTFSLKFPLLLVLLALLLPDHQIEGVTVPKFLQNKYGTKTTSAYTGSTNSHTKTHTKTHSKTHLPPKDPSPTSSSKYPGGCNAMPNITNAKVRCSTYSGCRAECLPDHQFPDGKPKMKFICVDGKWIDSDHRFESAPNCEPICMPPCQNNGICLSPNQCHCADNFSGPQCQFENKPCINYPPMPMNSKRRCSSKKCTITCAKGYEFSDGSQIATLDCKNGQWVPTKEKWASVPDCQPTCDPPCQNGGNCLSFNVCQCPQDFRGPQCQYNADVCSPKDLGFNGGYNCSGDAISFSCSVNCPPGIEFEFPPESVYTCAYELGMFLPMPVPNCIYPEFADISFEEGGSQSMFITNETHSTHSGSQEHRGENIVEESASKDHVQGSQTGVEHRRTVEERLPKPGACFHWGGSHYKTFDNRVYSFNSQCAGVLVRDSKDGTFSIITKNAETCGTDPEYCHKVIYVYLQNVNYVLDVSKDGIFTFKSANKTLPIPGRVPGVRTEMMASYLKVSLDTVGVEMVWDGKLLVQVYVKESLWNRTEGLCGVLDGDAKTDLITPDGEAPRNILTLASSWKVDTSGDRCDNAPTEDLRCSTNTRSSGNATEFCNKLVSDHKFKQCQNVLDITSLYDACLSDFCNCQGNDPTFCACQTFEVYVKHCSLFGVKSLTNWRDEDTCPMRCTNGKVYKSCGSATRQASCGALSEGTTELDTGCVEGCFCPEGTVLHEDKCITKDKCPCMLRGKSFRAGASVRKDCNTCTCGEGKWTCTQVDCGARCSAIGDPHYATFDGKKFDFMGKCSYYLVKTGNFSIEAENIPCSGAVSEALHFPSSLSTGMPTCTKTLTIRIDGQVVKLKQNLQVVANGEDVTRLPFSVSGINVKQVSSIFLLTKLPNGVSVWWDGASRAYIDLPAKFPETTKGLCGSFNSNQKDDFLTPQGDIEQAVIPFANKWKTSEHCPDLPEAVPTHPCDKNIHKRSQAEEYCSKIKTDLFKDCHFFVDPDQFYQDCMFDMCSCELPASKCLCPIIASYATACSRQGIKIDWRGDIRECGVHCKGGQKYQVCGNPCTTTCRDISDEPDCKPSCVEGCNCPEGQTLDDNGECIPIGECKCTYRGTDFPSGYKEIRPAPKGVQLCMCSNAAWECFEATPEDQKLYPNSELAQNKCNGTANMEFTTCEPVEPITCKNMDSPELYSPAVCHAGCKCKPGYVLDTSTKTCVLPTQCPCHHANKSYKENSVVQSGCNTCACKHGKWSCTDRQCAGECSAWGDSHYKTFDGKRYDYQGECDYVLSKGNLGADSYHITVQNVPCGSLGTACFKSVTIKVTSGGGTDLLSLEKNKLLPGLKAFKHLTVREKSRFVIVEAPELGLVLHWDKGTRVYVRLNPKWKDRTKGLCGNYNDNEMDDFQTPSGGLAEVSPNIFGDSWRLQPYCTQALEIEDTCASRPDRKTWSIKHCGILKSTTFAACHYEVPVEYYFDKCVFDSCACDQGGDCECMCTAVAAYAQECNSRGVAVKWRTPEFCPMQCDETCTNYSPCVSTCPEETCDNMLIKKRYSKTCGEDVCIEGCAPKSCPPGHVYKNGTHSECVPREQCRPVCLVVLDKTYYEGDLMEEDDCHSCYCSRQEKKCRGRPCSTTEVPTTPFQKEQYVQCEQGWTKWINQERPADEYQLSVEEIERIPSSVVLLNLNNSAKCSPEMMKSIECRTVKDHVPAKDTGLDVECSLEQGLICKSDAQLCPDFEIRLLCDCGETTTSETTTPEAEWTTFAPVCNVGESKPDHSDCSKYYLCVFDQSEVKWLEKTCNEHTMYNPKSKLCDKADVVVPLRPACGTSTTPYQPTTEWELITTQPPGCIAGDKREVDEDCTRYSVCVADKFGYRWIEEVCSGGFMYNPVKRSCDYPSEVNKVRPTCKSTTTTYIYETTTEVTESEETNNRTIAICAPGLVYDECAIECDKLCMHYKYMVRQKGRCKDSTVKCEAGCASASKQKSCPAGQMWLNEKTCASIESCMCVSEDGTPVKPGQVVEQPGCKKCQCIDNSYTCHQGTCTTRTVLPTEGGEDITSTTKIIETSRSEEESTTGTTNGTTNGSTIATSRSTKRVLSTESEEPVEVTEHFEQKTAGTNKAAIGTVTMRQHTFATPSVTPPPQCTEDRFIPLIQGDEPLPDEAFNASSFKEDIFAPHHARFSTEISEESGGSWVPKYQNHQQYLEIDLGKQEPVYGVIVRGSPLYDEYVTSYRVQYSPDGKSYYYVLDKKKKKPIIFRGSTDSTTEVKQYFDEAIEARKIRIKPKSWNNGISMQVELIGCTDVTVPTTATFASTTHIVVHTTPSPMFCDDPMGIEDSTMALSQISVSSSIDGKHGKQHLKLNDHSAWQPLTNSPTEWITFDFLEPRDITGLVVKGGPDGWVENFLVEYSNDATEWSTVMYGKKEKIFAGNYNSNMPQTNNFELPIRTRYLKVVPKKWHGTIQMRVEIHGCYQPYPTVTEVPTTVTPEDLACNVCPGVDEKGSMEMDVCRCLPHKWWDGTNCVDRPQCPCTVGYIKYPVGGVFEKDDCSDCICKLGGVPFCKPKSCPSCPLGLKSTVTATCACTCQPCPDGTTLCPTSNVCINSTLWCNGIEDCPDDEVDCVSTTESPSTTENPTTTESPSTTVITTTYRRPVTSGEIKSTVNHQEKPNKCKEIVCGPGFDKVLKKKKTNGKKTGRKQYTSQMLRKTTKNSSTKTKYSGSKGGRRKTAATNEKWQLATPSPALRSYPKQSTAVPCDEYVCVPKFPEFNNSQEAIEYCAPLICEGDQIVVLDEVSYDGKCQEFHCEVPPQPDAVCTIVGRNFRTFDRVGYNYEICNHVLARDLDHDDWKISLQKTCKKTCYRDLVIRHDWQSFVFHPDFTVEYDGYTYTLAQAVKLSERQEDFSIASVGRTLLFTSSKYGFWVIWTQHGNVKIGVDQQLLGKVDGLCGYFDGEKDGDKRKPDGSLSKTTAEFGDSWALSEFQHSICEAKACSVDMQTKAWEICNKVKEETLQKCSRAVDVEAFVSRCLETACTCLQESGQNVTVSETCKCQALQSFVEDCLSTDTSIDLTNWRIEQNCPAPCEAPLIYNDCYQRRCEQDCSNFADPGACPKVQDVCFSGCYCPAGYVREGDDCVPPSSCRNCECTLLPRLTYFTYDSGNFTVAGNCVYVMSRDVLTEANQYHKYQVLVTNQECSASAGKSPSKNHHDGGKMCVGKVTVLYGNHKIHIVKDASRGTLKMIYDGERVDDYRDIADVIKVDVTSRGDLMVLLKEIQVAVRVTYPNLGVNVKVPSYTFGGKMEGICGDCNGVEDDFKTPAGQKPKDETDFGLSWLYENLPGGQSRDQCEEPKEPEEKCRTLPGQPDPCVQLLDENKFGQCSNLVDPTMYLEWCRKDTCQGDLTESCEALEAYAKECALNGFCVNWRNDLCPAPSCSPGTVYSACGPTHPKTCDNLDQSTKNPSRTRPVEGCFCPDGKVLLNETCVEPRECVTCDLEGHHPGDVWTKDKCTTCKCDHKTLVCENQQCPDPTSICERGYVAVKVPTPEGECCDKHSCVPEPTSTPTCEPPQNLQCAADQVLKLTTKSSGCPAYVCECKPSEACEQIDLSSVSTKPGYVKEIDSTSSCCPTVNVVCKKDTCPPPPQCQQFYLLRQRLEDEDCCPRYDCEPPEKCVVVTEYAAASEGGERPLNDLERQKMLKEVNETWTDGPCRSCQCNAAESGTFVASCSKTTCPDVRKESDWDDYELVEKKTYGECCAKFKRTACKYHDKVYRVGEIWYKENDYCTSFKCAVGEKGYVQKETHVKSCETTCDVGFTYVKPAKDSKECCGYCKQVACLVDGETFALGKTWTSPDFCTEYICTDSEGSIQVKSTTQHCPKIPEENLRNFVIKTVPQPQKCCPKHVMKACKVHDQIIEVGDTWVPPEDPCKLYKCLDKGDNELSVQETIKTCKTQCGVGWSYRRAEGQCCGQCIQVACVIEGEIWKEGQTWKSQDGCTTFSCEKLGEHYSIVTQQETCPAIDEACPKENLYVDGCCQYCNVTPSALTQCSPQPIPLEVTVGILKVGTCRNSRPIANFTECVGSCESSTTFDVFAGRHESRCSCCRATAYAPLSVRLDCDDGTTADKTVQVPIACGCGAQECLAVGLTEPPLDKSGNVVKHSSKKGRRFVRGMNV